MARWASILLIACITVLSSAASPLTVNTPCTTLSASTTTSSVSTLYGDSSKTLTKNKKIRITSTSTKKSTQSMKTTITTTTTVRTTVAATQSTITSTTTLTGNSYLPRASTTVTTTSIATATTTNSQGLVVPTASGFLGVLDSLPSASYADPAPSDSCPTDTARALHARAAKPYAVLVTCTRATTFITEVTGTTTDTTTVQDSPTTVVDTVTITKTSTSTIHSTAGSKPKTVTTTVKTTITHQVTKTFTDLVISTTVFTVTSPSATTYDACSPSNLANYVQIDPSNSHSFSNAPTHNESVLLEDYNTNFNGNASDCCYTCFSDPTCAFVSLWPMVDNYPTCVRLLAQTQNGFTCDYPGQYTGGNETYGASELQLHSDSDYFQIMNGNCGTWIETDSICGD